MAQIRLSMTVEVDVDPDAYELAYGYPYGMPGSPERREFEGDVSTYVASLIRDGAASDSGIKDAIVRLRKQQPQGVSTSTPTGTDR